MTTRAPERPSALASRPRHLSVRDLITVGVYTAVYVVLFYAVGMTGVIPFAMALMPLLMPLATGIPFMLYLVRARTFGMLTVSGTLVGLVMMLTGHPWFVLAAGFLAGLAADLVWNARRRCGKVTAVVVFWLFSLWTVGAFMPFFVQRDAYSEQVSAQMGADYAEAVLEFVPTWYLPLIPVLAGVGAVIGGSLGLRVLRKHFERAGMV